MKPDFTSRLFKRIGNALYPADIYADELMSKIKDGRDVLIRIWKPRNIAQHNKMMAMIRTVVDNSDTYNSVEGLLAVLKIETGLYDMYKGLDGEYIKVARSISFGAMPQDEFEEFFPKATYILSQLSGISEDVLLQETLNATSSRRMGRINR